MKILPFADDLDDLGRLLISFTSFSRFSIFPILKFPDKAAFPLLARVA
jgi:hypothetical protein